MGRKKRDIKHKTISISLHPDLVAKLRRLAEQRQQSISYVVAEAIDCAGHEEQPCPPPSNEPPAR